MIKKGLARAFLAAVAGALITGQALAAQPDTLRRDAAGDLSRHFLGPAQAAGTWLLESDRGNLAIGGFVKVVTSIDDRNERRDVLNNPELLTPDDTEGRFQINPTLTRLFLDGRGPVDNGSVRGYTEFDLTNEPGFKVRHAYVELYRGGVGYTVGQTWSSFVDAKAFPGEASLPNTSGSSVLRQPMLRVRGRVAENLMLAGAVEDPTSVDVDVSPPQRRVHNVPDFHGELTLEKAGKGHVNIAVLLRSLKVAGTGVVDGSVLAAGVHGSGHLMLDERNKLTGGIVVGSGLGEYVAGLDGTSAGYVDGNGNLQARETIGAYGSAKWFWSDRAHSHAFIGFAEVDADPGQPVDTFLGTQYIGANVMWLVVEGVTIAVEYVYGRREVHDGSRLDNNRFSFVMQLL